MKGIVVLGSTGSIGQQTLDVVRRFPEELSVVGLSAWSNKGLLLKQAQEFRPAFVSCQDGPLPGPLPPGTQRASLGEMLADPRVDLAMVATVGAAGLLPIMEAIRNGKSVALANKEPVVMAGDIITAEARRAGVQLLPVDSEPSAIWQCLQGEERPPARLILTASGGALREMPLEELEKVTPEEALKHPTWKMGKKITIDSATLMNKAFEVIEAHWLFGIPYAKIDVVIHPQSIVHSLVEFPDGSLKAQLSYPDMRLPIQYALCYPRRPPNDGLPHLDLIRTAALTFEPLDTGRYPCFTLGLEAARLGGTYPTVLAAADEVAVDLFLRRRLPFTDIPRLVERVLSQHVPRQAPALEDILAADTWARNEALAPAEV